METLTHEGLKLVSTDDKFYLVPLSASQEVLEIDRLNFELCLIDKSAVPQNGEAKEICALIGIVHLLAGPYLIVATNKKQVGQIDGHIIYEITAFDIIPFSKTTIHLSEVQDRTNQQYLGMVQRVLATPGFYYSHGYDLSHCHQRKCHLTQTKPHFSQLPLHERADDRFVWNTHLLRDLVVQPELRRFIVPMIHGYVSIKGCSINGKPFVFVVISRRSVHRAGVRYFMRGLDSDGHVANYIETEQIVMYHKHKASFVQTRGSVPLYWSQRPTLKYKPTPLIDSTMDHGLGVQRHFDEQIVHYGQQVVINLLDQKGSEKRLSDAFQHYVNHLSSCLVGYDAFDFHKECSKMRWHRLNILTDRLESKQAEFGYFMVDGSGAVVSVQQGVFRTNCIDCLDRTNVVQSMFARRSLLHQLQRLQVLNIGEKVEDKKAFEEIFKNVWADNADYCAKQYTGTGALKTDFTRTGKRTPMGLLKDGYNSAVRYYYNNFYDGFRQDAIDLFLGNYVVDRWEGVESPSPLHIDRTWRFKLLPIVLLVGISMLFMSLILPSNLYTGIRDGSIEVPSTSSHPFKFPETFKEQTFSVAVAHKQSGLFQPCNLVAKLGEVAAFADPLLQLVYVLFWGAAVIITLAYLYHYGQEFIDSPKLVHKVDKEKML